MSLRVTLVSETYMPQINGVSRTLERLVDHCVQRGDLVQLMVPRYEEAKADREGIVRRSWRGWRLPFYREVILPLVTPRRLRREIAGFSPDLVHIATEGPLGVAALRACRQLGLPVVSSYHTNFPQYLASYRLGLLESIAWRYLGWFHNATSMTLCPTPTIRDVLCEHGFERVEIWSRGVDTRLFDAARRSIAVRRELGIGENEVVAVYAGRLAAEKNLQLLMDAWHERPAEGPDRLLLVGDGPLRGQLEARSADGVIFAGYRRGEDLARCYAAGDFFCFPIGNRYVWKRYAGGHGFGPARCRIRCRRTAGYRPSYRDRLDCPGSDRRSPESCHGSSGNHDTAASAYGAGGPQLCRNAELASDSGAGS
jgi:glycosyltransferase involved in cell wall biosynthesis